MIYFQIQFFYSSGFRIRSVFGYRDKLLCLPWIIIYRVPEFGNIFSAYISYFNFIAKLKLCIHNIICYLFSYVFKNFTTRVLSASLLTSTRGPYLQITQQGLYRHAVGVASPSLHELSNGERKQGELIF